MSGPALLLIVVAMCLALGTVIGAWRHMGRILERKRAWDVPLLWNRKTVRMITWVLTTVPSVAGALFAIPLFAPIFGEFGAKFSFGAILFLRWFASFLIGYMILMRKYTHEELF